MAVDVQHAVEDDVAELNVSINTTPLVDVMLVMLIIFLVTIPVITKTIPLQLPTYRNIVTQTKHENIVIAVTSDESVYYNNVPVDQLKMKQNFVDALKRAAASHKPFPEVHIRGDKGVRFEAIGRVITEPHSLEEGSY
jgi:biopolymer transport protein ExbD